MFQQMSSLKDIVFGFRKAMNWYLISAGRYVMMDHTMTRQAAAQAQQQEMVLWLARTLYIAFWWRVHGTVDKTNRLLCWWRLLYWRCWRVWSVQPSSPPGTIKEHGKFYVSVGKMVWSCDLFFLLELLERTDDVDTKYYLLFLTMRIASVFYLTFYKRTRRHH